MIAKVLDRDSETGFPHFSVLKASAGSGKTYTLTARYVQFLLSDRFKGNDLRNILAITFSNNAAREMKGRILEWLKALSFGDEKKISELAAVLSLQPEEMVRKAGLLVERILDGYSDFQVKTIDSFMTTVFKSSALDFGYHPDFDILLNGDALMRYAFELYLRDVRDGSEQAALFETIVASILENKAAGAAYLWDPSAALLNEIQSIYKKLASTGKRPLVEDLGREKAGAARELRERFEALEQAIAQSGLEPNGNSSYPRLFAAVREGHYRDLVGSGLKNAPVKKPKKNAELQAAYERIMALWEELGSEVARYTVLYVRSYYNPYLKVFAPFRDTVEAIKKHQGKVFIEDINWHLAEYLDRMIVPEVYFRIGEMVFHYLIDEFQDTSPVQWRNLFPLLEESLSKGGSAFVVGDTKQAIYGFRNADYRIMKGFETDPPFPSAVHSVRELETNYRSLESILRFNDTVFRELLPGIPEYREAGSLSGLTNYVQEARPGLESDGYAEVVVLPKDADDPPERAVVQDLVRELNARGFGYGEIAIITQKNEDAVRATLWLNERSIPFISYSSLDVRRRKLTGELVALLAFLDSPTDDLAFSTFLLGGIFRRALEAQGEMQAAERLSEFLFRRRQRNSPLYKLFQEEFPQEWNTYFEPLFRSAGYLPLYDLVTETFAAFRVFESMAEEEATLVKILEVVMEFEGEGANSLRDFLAAADDESDAGWTMEVPKGHEAVKVMTIHKAKGLGFPVAIVLLYEEQTRGFDSVLDPTEEEVALLRINQKTKDCDDRFSELYEREALNERVNRLNTLYVGFTRPEEELYVIGVRGEKAKYPFDLLPREYRSHPEKPQRIRGARPQAGDVCEARHLSSRVVFRTAPGDLLRTAERKRGEFIHRVLSHIECLTAGEAETVAAAITAAAAETGADYGTEELPGRIAALLSHPDIAAYFQPRPGREVRNEQEFVDGQGNLFRMDRVVVDTDAVTVIDYKTGPERGNDAPFLAQMKNYLRIASEVFPDRRPAGIIAFVDRGKVLRVS